MDDFSFNIPTKIIFGVGKIKELGRFLPSTFKQVMVVTDKRVAEKSGALAALRTQMPERHLLVYDSVEENPSQQYVDEGGSVARDKKSELIIGVGGGSCMDAAKGIAMLATNDGSMAEYLAGKQPDHNPLPIVCIPTTSGTGSEVTPYAVFTNRELQTKGGYTHQKLFPLLAIIDPELTYSMPPAVIVNTGCDVLTHAIEAYLSTTATEVNDLLALHAVEVVLAELPPAKQQDKSAMNNMAYASMLGGVVIAHAGTILLHIMAYPLTIFHQVPHGRANAALLPAFLRFMKQRSREPEKMERLASMFIEVGGVEDFIHSLDISTKLVDYGVTESELDIFVQKTIVKDDIKITPAEVTEEDVLRIYQGAL